MRKFDTIMAAALALALVCLCAPIAYAADAVAMPVDGGSDVAASVPAANPVPTPTTSTDALKTGKDAVAAARSGNWWLFSALVVSLLLGAVKFVGTKFGSWWAKLGRVRYVIPPVLSLAAALLATFQGGVSVDAAVGVFTASWAMSSWQELYEHGIMNRPRKGTGG